MVDPLAIPNVEISGEHSFGYCSISKMSRADRLWRWLGFGVAHTPVPTGVWEDDKPYMRSFTTIRLDWRDRLRVLVSGKLSLSSLLETDVPVGSAVTFSTCKVLPPNWKTHSAL